jgi:DNA-binding transcriptional ArsR family regulator
MGELVLGRPVLKQLYAVSAPLVLTSSISLTFRADQRISNGATAGYDPWLTQARQALGFKLEHDLDLLLGFSGRLLYYVEELLFAFEALNPDQLNADYEQYISYLASLPPMAFQHMAANAVRRVYRDRGVFETPPESNDDIDEWRMFLRPSLTLANLDEAAALITNPPELKERTLALIDGFWRRGYQAEYEQRLPDLLRAVRHAESLAHPVVQIAFAELTGHRLPDEIAAHLGEVERVTYCPSPHLGSFVQYIFYQPELILYFNPATVLNSVQPRPRRVSSDPKSFDANDALNGLKAVADPTRLRIIEMLREREHYAQEIVGRLGISQSAVSRHLGTLESANIVTVRPSQGMKYYAIDRDYLTVLADYVQSLTVADAGS